MKGFLPFLSTIEVDSASKGRVRKGIRDFSNLVRDPNHVKSLATDWYFYGNPNQPPIPSDHLGPLTPEQKRLKRLAKKVNKR